MTRKPIIDGLNIMVMASFAAMIAGFCSCEAPSSDEGTFKPPVEAVEEPQPGMWASFESKFNRYYEGEMFEGQVNAAKIVEEWTDTVWINDRVNTQIMVWSNDELFSNITYNVSDLSGETGTIPASAVTMKFGGYVRGHLNLWGCLPVDEDQTTINVADALYDTPVTAVGKGDDPVKIWLTVDIPETTAPGLYCGTVTIASGDTERELKMNLLVTNHVLPDPSEWTFHLDMWQFPFKLASYCTPKVEFASDEYFTLMEPFYRKLADVGQKAISTYVKDGAFDYDESMIDWTKKADGSWEYDFTKFDRFVEKMMEWGIDKQIDCFSPAGWHADIYYFDEAAGQYLRYPFISSVYEDEATNQGIIGDEKYLEFWTPFLDAFRTHLNEKGWFDKAVFYMDEAGHDDMVKIVDMLKAHDPAWKVGLAGSGIGEELENQLYDYCVLLGRESRKVTPVHTFYTCCTNLYPNNYVSPKTDPAEMVWMGWHAAGNGLNGYLRWGYDYWGTDDPKDATHGDRWQFSAGDGFMIYYLNNSVTSNALVNSIRLEMLREGIADYEKIKILNNPNVNAFADANFDIPYNDFPAINAIGRQARKPVTEAQALLKWVSANN